MNPGLSGSHDHNSRALARNDSLLPLSTKVFGFFSQLIKENWLFDLLTTILTQAIKAFEDEGKLLAPKWKNKTTKSKLISVL